MREAQRGSESQNLSLNLPASHRPTRPCCPPELSPVGPCGPPIPLPTPMTSSPGPNPTVLLPGHGSPVSLLTSQPPAPPNPFPAPARAHGSPWLPLKRLRWLRVLSPASRLSAHTPPPPPPVPPVLPFCGLLLTPQQRGGADTRPRHVRERPAAAPSPGCGQLMGSTWLG